MEIFFLIYISAAKSEQTEPELLDILRVSRENNERDNITGMLLYKDRRFMQVLEGNRTLVRATYDRIAADSRHTDVTILLEGTIEERDFPDWSMGFRTLNGPAARKIPGHSNFLKVKFSALEFADDPSRAHQLLRIFRRM